jgi:hypothetical protein
MNVECFRHVETAMFDFGSCTISRPMSCQWRRYVYSLLWTRLWLRPTFKFGQSVSCCLMTGGSSELLVIFMWGLARQDSCNVTSFEKKYLPSSLTSCKSRDKLNVLICQFLSTTAQFSLYNSYILRHVKLRAGGAVWNRLTIPWSIRDKENLRHVRSHGTRSLIKVFSVRDKDEPCEDYMWGEF